MQWKPAFSGLFFLCALQLHAQQDSSVRLGEAEVRAYPDGRTLLGSPGSISVIDAKQLALHHDYSLVPAMNTIPGVRMEERSPGSFRLSIRGSLLRSPFGIRNIKVYLDDFPLTDAGGNTYLNSLDAGIISRIEVLKGPEASIFGANSGGVVIINPVPKKADSNYALAGLSAGSYGMLHEKFAIQESFPRYRFHFTQGFQQSEGYRENSRFRRHYAQLFQQFNYTGRAQLKAVLLYSDLAYRTPGGLTQSQFESNARSARPATATLPGATMQQAGVYNKTWYAGLSHHYVFSHRLRHVITLFGSLTAFENPFITNYETRGEHSSGIRTLVEVSTNEKAPAAVKWQTGIEAQQSRARISNYGNRAGNKDTLQAKDELRALAHFYFTRLSIDLGRRLFLEAAASLNFYAFRFRNEFPAMQDEQQRQFRPQLMPRVALSYLITERMAWRLSASRGFSPPTLAEIRPSNLLVNTALQPENGWNYETGLRYRNRDQRWMIDACVYYFRLDEAIVRRLDTAGNEYFVNAGGTRQAGLELQADISLVKPRNTRLIRELGLRNSFTHQHFLFRNYQDATGNYSGNRLTGTPRFVNVAGLLASFPAGISLFVQYNYTGDIPFDDANTVYAPAYHLVQAKAAWTRRYSTVKLEVFAGADNILNQRYSLGNDLNAPGGRYYNPAPLRNYFTGINLVFL